MGVRSALVTAYPGSITQEYYSILNRPPSPTELAAATSLVVGGEAVIPQPPNPGTGYPGSPASNTLASSLVNTSEVINDVNTEYQTATGHGANAVEIAAAQSELISKLPMYLVDFEITQGQEGGIDYTATITPQAIGGSPGSYAYSALNSNSIISPNPNLIDEVAATGGLPGFRGGGIDGSAEIQGFNPATDVIGLQASRVPPPGSMSHFSDAVYGPIIYSTQAANGVLLYQDQGTTIVEGGGSTIYLEGVNENALTPANFRFF